jgi:transcriptional regulator with XRE-family HTH domain
VDDNVRRALGKRVRQLRAGLELSQEELAERCDLHWTHISGIERAQYDLKLSTLACVARGLRITLSELFAGVAVGRPKARGRRRATTADANRK